MCLMLNSTASLRPESDSGVRHLLRLEYFAAPSMDRPATRRNGTKSEAREAAKWLFLSLAIVVAFSAPAFAGSVEGTAAYQRGDYAIAMAEFRPLAEQGNAQAQYILGAFYLEGKGVEKNYVEAARWFRKASDQNNASAQNELGVMYTNGEGVAKDYAEAARLFRKAADQNYAPAQDHLGYAYAASEGVAKDYAQAVQWYRKAADQGFARAQSNLAQMYYQGQGVSQDYTQAAVWFRKAAEQGFADAQYNLGSMHDQGHGVSQDYSQAVVWYRKAADHGFALAQSSLAQMYYQGQGVPQDYPQAAAWFRKAADNGIPNAQIKLAYMYEDGLGVPKNQTEAEKWYRRGVNKTESFRVALALIDLEQEMLNLESLRKHGSTWIINGEKVTRENVDEYAHRKEPRIKILSETINSRGFKNFAGKYDAHQDAGAANKCGFPADQLGVNSVVSVSQDGFKVDLKGVNTLSGWGVAVESTFVLIPGTRDMIGMPPVYLEGTKMPDRIDLYFFGGEIGEACRIGSLTKRP